MRNSGISIRRRSRRASAAQQRQAAQAQQAQRRRFGDRQLAAQGDEVGADFRVRQQRVLVEADDRDVAVERAERIERECPATDGVGSADVDAVGVDTAQVVGVAAQAAGRPAALFAPSP